MDKLKELIYMILSTPLAAVAIKYVLNYSYIKSLIYCLAICIPTYFLAFYVIPFLANSFKKLFKIG
jgi:hypothetical protein